MWWWENDRLIGIELKLNRILAILTQTQAQEKRMAVNLDQLTAEVSKNTDATTSVVLLLNNLTQIIKAFPPSTDPVTQAALDNLVATLAGNDQAIAIAVTTNTQSPPPPSVSPGPASAKAPAKK